MTAVPHERPLPQPQSKAPPTVQSSHPDVVAIRSVASSRAASRTRLSKVRKDVPAVDFTSKPATLSLIRRTLVKDASQNSESRFTPRPIEDILPPLTSSNEIDLQLYAIVAVIVKDFVNTWYSKITQDHAFVEEIIQIIAHCSRALEQRIRHVDIAELILDELPVLLERHVNAYRTANSSLAQEVYGVHPRITYHNLNPHPALNPVPDIAKAETVSTQSENEAAYRQILVNGTLAVLLPTEDLRNAPLRVLVGDVVADLILGQALADKVCQGWFIYEAVAKIASILREKVEPKASGKELHHDTRDRLNKFGLLSAESEKKSALRSLDESKAATWFWRVLQWAYLAITAVWFVMQGLLQARHLPRRIHLSSPLGGLAKLKLSSPIAHEHDQSPRPVLAYGISNLISILIRLDDRMPWLRSTSIFCQHVLLTGVGRIGAANSVLDRFLHHVLTKHVFNVRTVVSVLVALRSALFPNNSMGPPAPPAPSPEVVLEIRRRAARALLELISPPAVAHRYFGTDVEDDILRQIEEDILGPFGDQYMNKHVIYALLELILARVVPELSEASVVELLTERGVDWGGVVDVDAGAGAGVGVGAGAVVVPAVDSHSRGIDLNDKDKDATVVGLDGVVEKVAADTAAARRDSVATETGVKQ